MRLNNNISTYCNYIWIEASNTSRVTVERYEYDLYHYDGYFNHNDGHNNACNKDDDFDDALLWHSYDEDWEAIPDVYYLQKKMALIFRTN